MMKRTREKPEEGRIDGRGVTEEKGSYQSLTAETLTEEQLPLLCCRTACACVSVFLCLCFCVCVIVFLCVCLCFCVCVSVFVFLCVCLSFCSWTGGSASCVCLCVISQFGPACIVASSREKFYIRPADLLYNTT